MCSPFQQAACTRQTPHQPPSFPLPIPSIIFFHHLQTPQGMVYMFSASYYENIIPISLGCFVGLFCGFVFFSRNSKETPDKKRHKYTNSCVLGPLKGSNCFVRWMWPSLVTWTESSPSLVLFGFINIAQVPRILFNLHRNGRRHISDTKATILVKFLRA